MRNSSQAYLKGSELKNALNAITNEEWVDLFYKLRNNTETMLKNSYLKYNHLLDAVGLVNESVKRVYLKTENEKNGRSWDGKSLESLYYVLWHTITSIISQIVRRELKKAEIYEKYFDLNNYQFDSSRKIYDLLIKIDVFNIFKDDPVVFNILKNLFDDPSLKPSDLSDFLEYDMQTIRNAYKRLRRKLNNYKDIFKRNPTLEYSEKAICEAFQFE